MGTKAQCNLDNEWVRLILLAKKLKLTPEEIRSFFQQAAVANTQTKNRSN